MKAGSKWAYHVINQSCICGLAASAGVWLRANEMEISATLWAHEAREGLYLFYTSTGNLLPSKSHHHVARLDDHTPAHRALSHVAAERTGPPALVLVGSDGQDTRAIHGSSRSAMVHPSAFVLNGRRLVVMATLG